jgi:CHAD domain-containing protein
MLHGVHTGDVTAIHRTRVASRRLREVLPVLQMKADGARKLGRSLRRVTRRLGRLRELDVLLLLLDELQESGRYPTRALDKIAVEVRNRRASLRRATPAKEIEAELQELADRLEKTATELADVSETVAAGRGWRWTIQQRVAHRAITLHRVVGKAGALYLPERLHAVRIAVKKLRYALEVEVDAEGKARTGELALLKRTQGILGRMHDLQILINLVREFQASADMRKVGQTRELDEVIAALDQSCRRLHGRYVRGQGAILTMCECMALPMPKAIRAVERTRTLRQVG